MNCPPKTPSAENFFAVLPALGLITTVFFANFLARTVFGPLLLPVSTALHLSISQGATIYLCLSGGYSVSVLTAGFLSQRLGHKKTILVSLLGIGGGLLGLSSSSSLGTFLLWTTMVGCGAGLYMPSGVATITRITPHSLWGHAFSLHELAPNLAFILAPVVTEIFLDSSGFRTLLVLLGAFCLLLAGVYAFRGPHITRPGVPPVLSNIRSIVISRSFWILTLFFLLAVGVEIGIYNLVPAFLVHEKGLLREQANLILSGTRLVALTFLPFTGLVVKRLGYHRTLKLCLLGTALTTFGSGFGPLWWALLMLTLQPIFVVCFFPVGFAVMALVNAESTNDLSVSLTVTCASIMGAGVLPTLLAWGGEHIGFGSAFSLFGAAIGIGSLPALTALRIPRVTPT